MTCAEKSYRRWWYSFTGYCEEDGLEGNFFVEFFLCNPALGGEKAILAQRPDMRKRKALPSYLMVKAGIWNRPGVQLNKFFAWKHFGLSPDSPFGIYAGNCFLSDDATRGVINITQEESEHHPEWMCGYGEFCWSLVMTGNKFKGDVLWNGKCYKVSPDTCNGWSCTDDGASLHGSGIQFIDNPGFQLSVTNAGAHIKGLPGKALHFRANDPLCRISASRNDNKYNSEWRFEFRKLRFLKVTAEFRCKKQRILSLSYEAPDLPSTKVLFKTGCRAKGIVRLSVFGITLATVSSDKIFFRSQKIPTFAAD
ncbi:MAG: hypothetical protein J5764_01190 [Bacteroidales bacterium]|nr:hypothetical protein [Bacteroidales bacterium]